MGNNALEKKQNVIAVCGVKNSGKTTLLTKLVEEMSKQGFQVAVIKHDGHDFECDIKGTDSDRLKNAGAYGVAVFSRFRAFTHKEGCSETLEQMIEQFSEADLIFLEGMKESSYPKIEVVRRDISDKPISNPQGRFLVATDWEVEKFDEVAIDLNDIDGMVTCIKKWMKDSEAHIEKLNLTEEMQKVVFDSLFFKGMDGCVATQIAGKLKGWKKVYQKNQLILCEDMKLEEIGILLSGELCKVQYFSDGTELMVQKLRSSYTVGLEIAISKKQTSPYSIYATQDSEIFWFPVKCVDAPGILKEEERIELYQRMIRFLASDGIRKYRKTEILLCKGAREKIEKYLKIQRTKYKSNDFQIEFNREQLANYLGMNRTVLSHELKKMEQEGLLKVRKNHFILTDKM